MRIVFAASAAAVMAAALAAAPAHAQLLVTSVTASFGDPNGKLPAFNAVPGEGIPSWSIGLAQGVLTHGSYYNYCVSLASGNSTGSATVSFKITRGKTVIQADKIISNKDYSVGTYGVWYYCSGYMQVPNSPGAATLTGSVAFKPTGATKSIASKTTAPVLIN